MDVYGAMTSVIISKWSIIRGYILKLLKIYYL